MERPTFLDVFVHSSFIFLDCTNFSTSFSVQKSFFFSVFVQQNFATCTLVPTLDSFALLRTSVLKALLVGFTICLSLKHTDEVIIPCMAHSKLRNEMRMTIFQEITEDVIIFVTNLSVLWRNFWKSWSRKKSSLALIQVVDSNWRLWNRKKLEVFGIIATESTWKAAWWILEGAKFCCAIKFTGS